MIKSILKIPGLLLVGFISCMLAPTFDLYQYIKNKSHA